MCRPRVLRFVLVSIAFGPTGLASGQPPTSPQAVWAGFDPRREPLEIEILKRWTEHEAVYTEFTFTGMTHEGSRVRVYALSSAPEGKTKRPGVLHVHGGGQTVNPQWLRFWNDRGYAALTFNWGGVWPGREKFTDWGKLVQGNHKDAGAGLMATKPSVRDSSWYLWTRISRRALTCLERMEGVDPERLGVFGVSMGGTIVWPMAATDDRIEAACAIYGVGWNTYPDEIDAPDPKAGDVEISTWRRAMEPESYAPLVKCPVLFLDATNDQHGKMDWSYRTLTLVPTEVRQAFTPRYRHHIAAEQGLDLPLWMDAHLKGGEPFPRSPLASVRLDPDGVPRLVVRPDLSKPIRRVDFFYAVENRNPKNRYWRSVIGRRDGETWAASLPVHDSKQPLFAFANVVYESGVCLSSNLVTVVPDDLGVARTTDVSTAVIDDFSHGIDGWVTRSPATDPVPPVSSLLRAADGPGGTPGVTVTQAIPILTHKVGDPRWRGPERASLQLRVFVRAPRIVPVVLYEQEFAPGWTQYAKVLRLTPDGGWQTVKFTAGEFTTEKVSGWRVGVGSICWSWTRRAGRARSRSSASSGGSGPNRGACS
jgi:dienelactone hydrolase